jgi:23S rRNA pseudouridine2605 synthase
MAYKKEFDKGKKPSTSRSDSKGKPSAKKSSSPFQKFFKPEPQKDFQEEDKKSRTRRSSEDKPTSTRSTTSNPFSKSKSFEQKFEYEPEEKKSSRSRSAREEKPVMFDTSDRRSRAKKDGDTPEFGDRPSRAKKDFDRFDANDKSPRGRKPFGEDRADRPSRTKSAFDKEERPARAKKDFDRFDNNDKSSRVKRDYDRFDSSEKSDRSKKNFDRLDSDNAAPSDDIKPRGKKLFEDDFFSKSNDRSSDFSRDRKPFDRDDKKSFGREDRKPFDRGDRKPVDRDDRKSFGRDDRKSFDRGDRKPFDRDDRKSFDRGDRRPFDRDDRPSRRYDDNKFDKKSSSKSKKSDNTESDIIRLNKFVAQSGLCSRRKAAEMIKEGEIWVNGVIELNPAYETKETDIITHKSVVLVKEVKMLYLLMNKPKNVITTSEDEKGRKTVLDLIEGRYDERVFPVGRLDRNTTGLLLLTNDGDLAKKLSHPSHMVKKFYQAELDRNITQKDLDKIREGLTLEDGVAEVDAIDYVDGGKKNEVGVEIHIGKNRIVRRIFEALGYEVVKLDRLYYGGLTKKDLPRGFVRELTEQEIIMLKHFTNKRKKE